MIAPRFRTVSRTTRAMTPFGIRCVCRVTTTTASSTVPSPSVSRYVHRVPGSSGQYGLVTSTLKSRGSRRTGAPPVGRVAAGVVLAVMVAGETLVLSVGLLTGPGDPPLQPETATARARTVASRVRWCAIDAPPW